MTCRFIDPSRDLLTELSPEIGQLPDLLGRFPIEENPSVRRAAEPGHVDRDLLIPPIAGFVVRKPSIVTDAHPLAIPDDQSTARRLSVSRSLVEEPPIRSPDVGPVILVVNLEPLGMRNDADAADIEPLREWDLLAVDRERLGEGIALAPVGGYLEEHPLRTR